LTLGADPADPARPYSTYFRMVAADNVQGPFLARYAYADLGARRVAVVSESKPVSQGLAEAFADAFSDAGGEVVLRRNVADGTTDFAGVLDDIAPLGPDLLFYGGEYDVGSRFTAQAEAASLTAPVMGGDGLKDDAYIVQAGPASDGDLASTVGAPPASIPSASRFLEAYSAAGFGEPPSNYGVDAYDAPFKRRSRPLWR
jgi:branched-chain amino acid transport system substrate-binding protein